MERRFFFIIIEYWCWARLVTTFKLNFRTFIPKDIIVNKVVVWFTTTVGQIWHEADCNFILRRDAFKNLTTLRGIVCHRSDRAVTSAMENEQTEV